MVEGLISERFKLLDALDAFTEQLSMDGTVMTTGSRTRCSKWERHI